MNVRRSSILPVVLLIITSPVSGQVSYRVAARSGQAAPNTNGAILGTGFGGPFIDENGRVGFTNRLVNGVGDATISNYDCIYSDVGGSLHIVARLGDPTPGNINYHWGTNSFTTLAMSPTGQIVFHGVAIGNAFGGDGIWAQNAAGGVNYIAISGEDVPGLPGVKYQTPDYGYKCMSATADVPFSSILQQGVGGVTDFNNEILMVSTGSGPYRIVAREGDLLPSPLGGTVQVGSTWGGAVHVFSARILMNDGAITFYASTSGAPLGGSSAAIFSETRTMAALRVVVGDNEDAPGLGPNVKFGPYLDFSVNAGGNVAFVADLQGSGVTPGLNTNSEWMEAGGALVLVARQGDAAPGGGVYETVIYPPVISADGWITFPAWLRQGVGGITTANDVGIFLGQSEGNAIKVMGEGQDAPGLPAGYKFGNELVSPSINNSHRVAFNASISGGAPFSENQDDSIWATDENGALVLVAAKGESFQVGPGDNRIITGCGDVVRGTAAQDGLGYQFNNANQLAFTLTFSGGTTAVVIATIGGAPCIAPNITAHPTASQSVCNGGAVQLSVTADGTPAPTFQWRRGVTNISNDAHITGATTSTLTINPVGPDDVAADYNCLVTNACGNPVSNNAQISLSASTSINSQPLAKSVIDGEAADFTVAAVGSGTPNYQWRRNGTAISNSANVFGTTTAHLIINPAHTTDAGNYDVIVSSACGTLTSNAAALTIDAAPAGAGTSPPAGTGLPSGGGTGSTPGTSCGATGGGGGACGAGMATMLPLALAASRRRNRRFRRKYGGAGSLPGPWRLQA